MAEDVSKTTVLVLLVLTILVSILGTWTVIDAQLSVQESAGQQTAQNRGSIETTGQIRLNLEPANQKSTSTGNIVFEVRPEGQ